MKILLGVSGGVAAYKAAELVRTLQNSGADVQVAMTRSAQRFVTPLTFAALTGHEVLTSLWGPSGVAAAGAAAPFSIEHITAGQGIDVLAIAPCTASLVARLAHGLATDFLSTLYLATTAPVVLAPAMNVNMWEHPATQANLRLLTDRGTHIVLPEPGYLACGMTGTGRLARVETIAAAVLQAAEAATPPRQDLNGDTVLITAGGTREPLDPVRFLGNRSSGRMGHALAAAALARGARVILITASTLPTPHGCQAILVQTAAEMATALLEHLPEATIVVGSAAVADFRPRAISPTKLRRHNGLTLELEPTEDIIALAAAHRRPGALVLAFAAEAEPNALHLEAAAREKLHRKAVDAVIANDISQGGSGFDVDHNSGLFVTAETSTPLPPGTKRSMADRIFDRIATLRHPESPTMGSQKAAGTPALLP